MKTPTRASSPETGAGTTASPHATREPPNKLPTVRHSPLQARMEERAHAAAVRRSAAATTMPCAFGSTSDRNLKVIGLRTHLDTQQEESPDPGSYNVYESSFSNNITQSQSGFSSLPSSPAKNASTLWSRSTSPRMSSHYNPAYSRHLGPETYNAHQSMDAMKYKGSVWLDTSHASSIFASKTKRFEVPGMEKLELPDSCYSLDQEAKLWTSKGHPAMKEPRMTKHNVHQVEKGFLQEQSCAPGYIYNTDCPMLPTIATQVANAPSISSAIFRDKSERFPDPKFQYSRPLGPDTYSGAWFRAIKV